MITMISCQVMFQLMVVGTSDGSVQVYSLVTGQVMVGLSQSTSMVYQVRMVGSKVLITMGRRMWEIVLRMFILPQVPR